MRFRYFDSEGTEVGLSSVDALRFRIQTGVVTPETLLYDAAAGQWAPARQNPLFRFLVEEDEDLLPEEHRDLMDGGRTPDPSSGPETGSSVRWSSPRADFDEEELDAAVDGGWESLEEPELPHAASSLPEVDASADDATALEEDAGFPDLELTIPDAAWARAEEPRADEGPSKAAPTKEGPPGGTGAEETAKDGTATAGTPAARPPVRRVPTVQAPAENASPHDRSVRHRSFPTAPRGPHASHTWITSDPEPTYRDGYTRRRRARPSLAGVGALSILMVFLVGIPILVLGAGEGDEDGAAYALVGGLADDLVSGEGRVADHAGDVDRGSAESESRESARGGTSAFGSVPSTASERLEAEEIESLAVEVDAAAAEDLEDALVNLRIALRVPQTPPAAWLQGRYLAEAASFSGVERYWIAFASLVTSMKELEGELYRGFLQSRVLGMRLDTADAASVSALARRRYDDRSEERAALYRDLDLLASNAIALHDTLVARSDDMTDRAFDGTTLTRYPFMAAAPGDPVLAERVWSRVDEILDLIRVLDGARPTSVTELRAAVRRTTPGGAGDPLDELPDWWPRPTDRRVLPPTRSASVDGSTSLGSASSPGARSDPTPPEPIIPGPGDLPVPIQEVVVPD
ncbi:MAG: hypothetical protein ACOC8K_04935 [Gemmatimonadota bacterium]